MTRVLVVAIHDYAMAQLDHGKAQTVIGTCELVDLCLLVLKHGLRVQQLTVWKAELDRAAERVIEANREIEQRMDALQELDL